MVSAFATASSGDGETNEPPEGRGVIPASDRRTLDGVGRGLGTFAWTVADRSRRAASGDVSGRK